MNKVYHEPRGIVSRVVLFIFGENDVNHDRAKAILPFVAVLERDTYGRIATVHCPASPIWTDGKRTGPRHSEVRIERSKEGLTLACHCFGSGDASEGEVCLGSRQTLCYHELAALQVIAGDQGGKLQVYSTIQAAEKARGDGIIVQCRSKDSDKVFYLVWTQGKGRTVVQGKARPSRLYTKTPITEFRCRVCQTNPVHTKDGVCPICTEHTGKAVEEVGY